MIVDAHTHVSLTWYEPVETLLFQMDRNQVEKAVLVQMWSELDNAYQTACAQRYPERLASVVMVDATAPDAESRLERLVEQGAHGLRMRPTTRSPGDDPLRLWRAAARLGISVSCVGRPAQFASDDFAEVVAALPELPVVVEHIAELQPLEADHRAEDAARVFALSRFDNVYIKVHGLGEFAARDRQPVDGFPFQSPVPDLIQRAHTSFGAHRVMWGSDYPPVSRREGYTNALRFARQQLEHLPDDELDQVFGGTASRLYGLDVTSTVSNR